MTIYLIFKLGYNDSSSQKRRTRLGMKLEINSYLIQK